jgi:hypothetical protein
MTAHESIGHAVPADGVIALIRMRLTNGSLHAAEDRE